jgi:hypothetical protein|tara:strand:- start:5348 stop:6358 length:1011 start_codon:yes stop_codon:yes gene_type:complete
MSKRNDTLVDIGRRELAFDGHAVQSILPAFFADDYPKLITLLNSYYEFEDRDGSAGKLVHELFFSRDITQTDLKLLSFIEDELLLGQSYFEGFADKRAAAKYSSSLYRSKGTKYSIEQFFRTFFGVDPEIIYTKENVFKVGDDQSTIGIENQRYLTDNKLYQTFALLVKTDIAFNDWKEPYKLFTHPAGMYVGSEVQIVSVVTDTLTAPLVVVEPPPPLAVHSTASFGDFAIMDITALVDDLYTDSAGVLSRINAELTSIEDFSLEQIQTINNQYSSLREAQTATSPTFDDSDASETNGMDLSNNFSFETLDQDRHQWWSSDSAQYVKSFGIPINY